MTSAAGPASPPVPDSARGFAPALRRAWRRLPLAVRRGLFDATDWTGVPYLVALAALRRRSAGSTHFAGELPALLDAYQHAPFTERQALLERFDAILDALVLPNGVRKTCYAERARAMLITILDDPACALPDRPLRVLDLPASTGAASLAIRADLGRYRLIERYVLADLSFHLWHDPLRDCVYDADGVPLQVRHDGVVHALHLPHGEGPARRPLPRLLLAPLAARLARVRATLDPRTTRGDGTARGTWPPDALTRVPLLHPDVPALLASGHFELRTWNVFAPIPETFDLIVSCNLLQTNYFAATAVAQGVANLGEALAEDGLLIVGRPDDGGRNAHRVYRRRQGRLVLCRARGRL